MKTFVGLALVILAACGLSLAISSNAPNRPPGIATDRWAPISNTMGVVLVPDSELNTQLPLPAGAGIAGPKAGENPPIVDRMALIAPPSPAVEAIIEEGHPVRGYIMVKRGKVWRPLAVIAPTIN
jgi:hypothetical protein